MNTDASDIPNSDYPQEINNALEELYENTLYAVNIMNDRLNSDILNIIKIEEDLLPLLFNFEVSTNGFVLVSPKKYIFFISDNIGKIYTFGLDRKNSQPSMNITGRSVQLLTVSYNSIKGNIAYYDSTGSLLDPQEIVYQILKWATV